MLRDLAGYTFQFVAFLVLSIFATALLAVSVSWVLATISYRLETAVQTFWLGPGLAVSAAACLGFTFGFFIATNWAAEWGFTPSP
jgi:hypothetical protein